MMTLALRPDTEERLRRVAAKGGKSPEAVIEEALALLFANEPKPGRTGAELLRELKALDLSPEYSDMSLSADELATKLRGESNTLRYA